MPDVNELLRDAASGPTAPVDPDRVWRRGRRRRRFRLTVAAAGSTAIVVALWAVVTVGLPIGPPEIADVAMSTTPTGAPTTALPTTDPDLAVLDDPGARRTPLPDGWQALRIGDASLGVPGDWPVVAASEDVGCDRSPVVVVEIAAAVLACTGSGDDFLDDRDADAHVVLLAGTIRDVELSEQPNGTTTIDGLDLHVTSLQSVRTPLCTAGATCPSSIRTSTTATVPALGLQLRLLHEDEPDLVDQILATIEDLSDPDPGPVAVPLAGGRTLVRADMIHLVVPDTYTVIDVPPTATYACNSRRPEVLLYPPEGVQPIIDCVGEPGRDATVYVRHLDEAAVGEVGTFAPVSGSPIDDLTRRINSINLSEDLPSTLVSVDYRSIELGVLVSFRGISAEDAAAIMTTATPSS